MYEPCTSHLRAWYERYTRSHRGQPYAPAGLENGAANIRVPICPVVSRRDRREDILVVNCLPVWSGRFGRPDPPHDQEPPPAWSNRRRRFRWYERGE